MGIACSGILARPGGEPAHSPAHTSSTGARVTVAALYVEKDGVYAGLPGVEVWDEARDARLYAGPWPVVAHPPCARWSTIAGFVEAVYGHKRGEDDGCFAAALNAVRTWGGVLEHPAHTRAFRHFGLPIPGRGGGWVGSLTDIGVSCWVDQGWYGHALSKPTWVYAVGVDLAAFRWGAQREGGKLPHRDPTLSATNRQRLTIPTPPAFRDVLIAMARTAARVTSA